MVRGNELSPIQHASIVAMHDTGLPIRRIAELASVSKTGVHKTIQNFKERGSFNKSMTRLSALLDSYLGLLPSAGGTQNPVSFMARAVSVAWRCSNNAAPESSIPGRY
ncbi:uncharacterized protein UBRO_20498 [Ustilago bromivora]|uniref:Uncharacterized protein n=1 Tax=Ustilago bromivora TaxID=307758 RepID=A0A1K0FYI2_9BASI|nr:uncharacterized protein UBRO_20498 [Ustilago bromivora]